MPQGGGRERAVAGLARGAREAVLSAPEVTRSGRLRPDFVVDDLVLVLMAHRGLQDTPREARAAASRRYAAYVIEAFHAAPAAEAATPLPPAPRLST